MALNPLDAPVWEALGGRQRRFALWRESACRYHPDIAPFAALAPAAVAAGGDALAGAWEDLAALVAPGGSVGLVFAGAGDPTLPVEVPAGWLVDAVSAGVQMVAGAVEAGADPEATALGSDDVADMLDLVGRARPGPFRARTVELGGYVGRRAQGRLVAMAGERMAPAGFAEISAVATDPQWRGRGLASALVRHVAAAVASRGDTAFLHAAATNTTAINLYRHLGFSIRRQVVFLRLRRAEQVR